MGFKTVGKYDDENSSGVINFGAMLNQASTEKFDERIKWVRGMDREKRIETAQICLAYIENTIGEVMKDQERMADWVFTFVACVNELACAGLDPVPMAKKRELAEMLSVLGDADAWLKKDILFDWRQFRDKDHQMLVESFLGICREPELHQYPGTVANYMLAACCADRPNENGIKAARYVWTEYLEYVRRVNREPNYEYKGTYDRSHFRTTAEQGALNAQQKRAEEAKRRAEEEKSKKDAQDRAAQLGRMGTLKAGDTFLFGSYPQSSRKTSERVEWKVLDRQGDRILAVSEKILADEAFHKAKKTTPWSDSLIRRWLEEEFLPVAFNADEQSLILPTQIREPDSAGTVHTTTDRVFLLSEEEARKYMPKPADRAAAGTAIAADEYWGLRSYQAGADSFRYVTAKGLIQSNRFGTDGFTYTNYDCTIGVRPAMWLTTKNAAAKALAEKAERKASEKTVERCRKEASELNRRQQEAQWRVECAKVVKLRLEEIDQQVEQECRRLVEAAERQKKQELEALEKTIERCRKETADKEQELGLLKFYQLGAKKELREAMDRLEAEIKTAENKMVEQEEWFREEQKRIEEKKPSIREAARKTVFARYPLPKKEAASIRPRMLATWEPGAKLREKLIKLEMATREELEAQEGTAVSDELKVLQEHGLVEAVTVDRVVYYVALSGAELHALGCEEWPPPGSTVAREENKWAKEAIMDFLKKKGWSCTISELRESVPVLATIDGMTEKRVAALVSQLKSEGRVLLKELDGQAYLQKKPSPSMRTMRKNEQSPSMRKNEQLKKEIVAFLEMTEGSFTILELWRNVPALATEPGMTEQRISALVTQLRTDGVIVRWDVRRNSYFSIA